MKNKKGFTLVELLAVIVILALIMSIAIVSIGGILRSTRESTFKETAATIIHGVRQELTLANKLPNTGTGNSSTMYYGFSKSILDKDPSLPLGGNISYNTTGTKVGSGAVTVLSAAPSPACGAKNAKSYVKVTYDDTSKQYTFYICLMPDNNNDPYIQETTEASLLTSDDNTMIKTTVRS